MQSIRTHHALDVSVCCAANTTSKLHGTYTNERDRHNRQERNADRVLVHLASRDVRHIVCKLDIDSFTVRVEADSVDELHSCDCGLSLRVDDGGQRACTSTNSRLQYIACNITAHEQ